MSWRPLSAVDMRGESKTPKTISVPIEADMGGLDCQQLEGKVEDEENIELAVGENLLDEPPSAKDLGAEEFVDNLVKLNHRFEITKMTPVKAVRVVPVTQSFIGEIAVSDLKNILLDVINGLSVLCSTILGITSWLFIVLLLPSLLNAFPIWLVHGQLKGLWHICRPPPKPPPFNLWLFASVSCLYFQLHATCLMKCPTTVGNIAHCQRHFGVTQYKISIMPAICHHVNGYFGVILMRDQELFNASNPAVDFFGTFFPTADFSWLCRPPPKPPPRAATLLPFFSMLGFKPTKVYLATRRSS